MVLLDLLRKRPGIKLIVAHFDHGIRDDSHLDRELVKRHTHEHKLTFVHGRGQLGPKASEAKARHARYDFLRQTRDASGAKAIITAHHQDDLLETAVLNMLRGTGRRGLTALKSTDGIIRPLLAYPKDRLQDYAAAHKIPWREDGSNQDTRYKRNYIRHQLLASLTPGQRAQILILLEQLGEVNEQLDGELVNLLHTQPKLHELERGWFIALPHDLSREVLHHWLSRFEIQDLSRKQIDKLVIAMKTGKPHTKYDVDNTYVIEVGKQNLALTYRER